MYPIAGPWSTRRVKERVVEKSRTTRGLAEVSVGSVKVHARSAEKEEANILMDG